MPPSTKPTLEYFLRPRAVASAEVVARHPDVVPLVARILGVVPRVFSYLEMWPPAFRTYALVVPSFFDLPFCDLGFGIGSKTRSLVAYAASRGHGCMYCSAHSAVLGNVFRGAGESLERNAGAIQDGVCQLPEPRDRAVIDYGMAVGRGGTSTCTREIAELTKYYSQRQIEQIVLVAATMGLLNRCLDTLGMVLEGPLLTRAREALESTGWNEEAIYRAEFDAELLNDEAPPPPPLGPLGVLRCMRGAIRFESTHLARFSNSERGQERDAREALGFCPAYLMKFSSSRARKTLLHLLVDRLVGLEGSLPPKLRCAIAFVFADANDDALLKAHFAYLMSRAGSAEDFERLLTLATVDSSAPVTTRSATAEGTPGDDRKPLDEPPSLELVCLCAAREASSAPVRLQPDTVRLLSEHLDDEQIIQFVLTLSVANTLQRIVRSFPQTPEPEIADFVQAHGAAWGLSPSTFAT